MKLRDIIEAERYFGSDKKPLKKEPSIKDMVKFLKSMDEFQKFMKEKEKKEEKKTNGTLFPEWSVAKKTAFFTIAGPPLGIMYIGCIVLMVRGLAMFVVGAHQ